MKKHPIEISVHYITVIVKNIWCFTIKIKLKNDFKIKSKKFSFSTNKKDKLKEEPANDELASYNWRLKESYQNDERQQRFT